MKVQAREVRRAVATATSVVSSLGLVVDDATVLQSSNRLTLRMLPCDIVARVAPVDHQVAQLEVDVARRLAGCGSPVAALDPRVPPRVHQRDGFVVTLWTYYAPAAPPATWPADYGAALHGLHTGMRRVDVAAPHVTERVDSAQQLVADRARTPALAEPARQLLGGALRDLRRVVDEQRDRQQLLHGEPHPGNVLTSENGLLFIDLETCCRGPVEFDLAHAPPEVGDHYPGVDQDLLRDCRILVLAMVTSWRWERGDQLPDGRRLRTGWLDQLRAALPARGS